MRSILGISAFYHDSAECILVDGKICETGGPELAKLVENEGYSKFSNA